MRRFSPLLLLIPTFLSASGMYIPIQSKLPSQDMKNMGLRVSPAQVEKLATGAVVRISGCSGAFLSSQGLIGTNWHCAENCVGFLQAEAQKKDKKLPLAHLQATGYVAPEMKDELACRGYEVHVPTDISNVSSRFKDLESGDLQPKERAEKIRKQKETVREECMKNLPDVVCDVVEMNNEKDPYFLYKYRRYRDVRLVWTPPHVIGEFGGSTDNWEYPRHSGDFAFLRVYDKNEPLKPAQFAKVSSAGVKAGDPQFILGFPGSTQRNITSDAAQYLQDSYYPYAHKVYEEAENAIRENFPSPMSGPYAAAWFYLENYRENFDRKSKMIKDLGIVRAKRQAETANSNGAYLNDLQRIYRDLYYYSEKAYLLDFMVNRRSPAKSLLVASYIWQWATQPRDDRDRADDRFKSWNKELLEHQVRSMDNIVTLDGEKAILAKYFELASSLPTPVEAFEQLKAETVSIVRDCYQTGRCGKGLTYEQLRLKSLPAQMAEVLLSKTSLVARVDNETERKKASARRMDMFRMTPRQLTDTHDSLLLLAKNLVEELETIRSNWELGAPQTYELDRLNHFRNMIMGYETPDANSTIRFTASTVQEKYEPIYKAGTYPFATTLTSMVAKDKSVDKSSDDYDLFLVPPYIKAAAAELSKFHGKFYYDPQLKDVPVNFITSHLITGGNSGSPVFNADGQVVGFAFDGTPESIVSDLTVHPKARTIVLDIRFVGYLADTAFPLAKRVTREMGLP